MASHLADFDLVIAADTLVAYSVRALGLPLWMLRKAQPDWRWSGGDASLWYHQACLFLQSQPGIWAGVLTEACYAFATAAG